MLRHFTEVPYTLYLPGAQAKQSQCLGPSQPSQRSSQAAQAWVAESKYWLEEQVCAREGAAMAKDSTTTLIIY